MHQLTTTSDGLRDQALAASQQSTVASTWRLCTAVAVLSFVRLAGLTHQSLWYDEGYTLTLASSTSFSAFLKAFFSSTTSEHLQPLYYFFLYFWSRVAGTSDVALRLPSAIFSIASGLVVYDLCVHLPRVRRSFPLMACAAIGFSSFSVYYAQDARPYALLQLLSFALLSLWLRRKYHPAGNSSLAVHVAFVMVCGLCLLGSSFTALLVFSLCLAELLTLRALLSWFRAWRAALLFAAACTLSYLWLALRHLPSLVLRDVTSIKQPLWMNSAYTVYGILFGTTLGPSNVALRSIMKLHIAISFWPVLLPCALTIVALTVGVARVLGTQSRLRPELQILAVALAIYAVVFFGFFGYAGQLNILPRHASALFPLLFTVVLLCAYAQSRPHRASNNEWLTVGLACWLALNLLSAYGYRVAPEFQKDDYRAAAQVLAENERLPTFMTEGQPALMQHYGVAAIDATEVEPRDLTQFLRTRSADAPQIELLVNEYRGYRWDQSTGPIEVLAPTYACALDRHLPYMDLIVCRLAAPSSRDASSRRGPVPERTDAD